MKKSLYIGASIFDKLTETKEFKDLAFFSPYFYFDLVSGNALIFGTDELKDDFLKKLGSNVNNHWIHTIKDVNVKKKLNNKEIRLDYTNGLKIQTESKEITFGPFINRLFNFTLNSDFRSWEEGRMLKVEPGLKHTNINLCRIKRELNENLAKQLYDSVFCERNELPLVLPIGEDFSKEYYYYSEWLNPRKLFKSIFDNTAFKNSLFYHLWEYTETPLFWEYLRKGGQFELKIKANTNAEENALDGNSELNFQYNYNEADYDRKWFGQLIDFSKLESENLISERDILLDAIKYDFENEIANLPVQINVGTDSIQAEIEWAKLNFAYPDYGMHQKEGIHEDLEKLRDKGKILINELLDRFIEDKIKQTPDLDNSRNHEKALYNLTEYFCKCPLQEESQIKAWKKMLQFMIKNDDIYDYEELINKFKSSGNFKFDYDKETKECVYSSFYSPEYKFFLRLILPPGSYLKSLSSNVLNSPNAILDNNFIFRMNPPKFHKGLPLTAKHLLDFEEYLLARTNIIDNNHGVLQITKPVIQGDSIVIKNSVKNATPITLLKGITPNGCPVVIGSEDSLSMKADRQPALFDMYIRSENNQEIEDSTKNKLHWVEVNTEDKKPNKLNSSLYIGRYEFNLQTNYLKAIAPPYFYNLASAISWFENKDWIEWTLGIREALRELYKSHKENKLLDYKISEFIMNYSIWPINTLFLKCHELSICVLNQNAGSITLEEPMVEILALFGKDYSYSYLPSLLPKKIGDIIGDHPDAFWTVFTSDEYSLNDNGICITFNRTLIGDHSIRIEFAQDIEPETYVTLLENNLLVQKNSRINFAEQTIYYYDIHYKYSEKKPLNSGWQVAFSNFNFNDNKPTIIRYQAIKTM